MKQNFDLYTFFENFNTLIEKYFGQPIVTIYSDEGGEYKGLATVLLRYGIQHLYSSPHTPQRVSTTERLHRHIMETTITFIMHLFPQNFGPMLIKQQST